MPNYCGDQFIQMDALEFLSRLLAGEEVEGWKLEDFAAIHASPPCQAFTSLRGMHNAKEHPDLLTPTRELLIASGLPYVIENVPGAPLLNPVTLCGTSFGLGTGDAELRRHRLFECSFPVMSYPCCHGVSKRVIGVYGGHARNRTRTMEDKGNPDFTAEQARKAMGIDWMTGAELSQAIPPAYCQHVGSYLLSHIEAERKAVAA